MFCDDQLVYFPVCTIVVKDCRKLNNFKKENKITDLLKQKQKKNTKEINSLVNKAPTIVEGAGFLFPDNLSS